MTTDIFLFIYLFIYFYLFIYLFIFNGWVQPIYLEMLMSLNWIFLRLMWLEPLKALGKAITILPRVDKSSHDNVMGNFHCIA